jgi:hypothetical protein
VNDAPINVLRYAAKIRAMFGIRGDNPAKTIKDILPVVVVEGDRPENAYGLGNTEGLRAAILDSAAVAAQNSWGAIYNPAGSGIIGIVDVFASITVVAAGRVQVAVVGQQQAAFATIVAAGAASLTARDTRLHTPTIQVSGLKQSFGSAVGALVTPMWDLEDGTYPWPVVLAPGSALLFSNITLNERLEVNIVARERAQERGITS